MIDSQRVTIRTERTEIVDIALEAGLRTVQMESTSRRWDLGLADYDLDGTSMLVKEFCGRYAVALSLSNLCDRQLKDPPSRRLGVLTSVSGDSMVVERILVLRCSDNDGCLTSLISNITCHRALR